MLWPFFVSESGGIAVVRLAGRRVLLGRISLFDQFARSGHRDARSGRSLLGRIRMGGQRFVAATLPQLESRQQRQRQETSVQRPADRHVDPGRDGRFSHRRYGRLPWR